MKYLKFIVIIMGLLIFFGTSAIIYIIFDRLFSKQTFIFPQKEELKKIQIEGNSEIVNANISDDKLILTIKLNQDYQIIIYDLNSGKQLYFFETNGEIYDIPLIFDLLCSLIIKSVSKEGTKVNSSYTKPFVL